MTNFHGIGVFLYFDGVKLTGRRFNTCVKYLMSVVLSVFLGVVSVNAGILFTGNVESDFSGAGVFVANDYLGGIPATDVGVPPQISGNTSGWDMSRVYFFSNINQLFIGID